MASHQTVDDAADAAAAVVVDGVVVVDDVVAEDVVAAADSSSGSCSRRPGAGSFRLDFCYAASSAPSSNRIHIRAGRVPSRRRR